MLQPFKAHPFCFLNSGFFILFINGTVNQVAEAKDFLMTAKTYQLDVFFLARLKTNSRSCSDIQPLPKAFFPFKPQLFIHLKKMKMRTDLYWPVTRIHYADFHSFPPRITFD